MFYKTKKESETGKKFQEVVKKRDIALKAQKELAAKYGFKQYRPDAWCPWGGFSSCLDFNETPNKKIWGRGACYGEYMPKRNSNTGKAIAKEFEEMPVVSIRDLNICIGFDEDFSKTIGFASSNSEYFGFVTKKEWGISIPDDCEEITETKYDELFKKK